MKNHWLDKKDEEYTEQLAASITEVRKHYEAELEAQEQVAAQGYKQAYEIITHLQKRLEEQREMYEQRLEEGFNEAFEMLQAERKKTDTLEVDLYEEYDKKLRDIRKFMVDKVADYLDKIIDQEGDAAKLRATKTPEEIVDEAITGEVARPEEERGLIANLREQVKIMEARNMRLAIQPQKANEQLVEKQVVPSPLTPDDVYQLQWLEASKEWECDV